MGAILAFLTKIGIGSIVRQVAQARIDLAKAETDRDKIAAEERVKALEARRDVLVAESGSRINSIMRALIATPVAIVLWKIFVFDKALGQWTGWTTDAMSPELWHVVMIVIGFYFLSETASTVSRIVRRH